MPMDVMPIIPPHTPGKTCFCDPLLGTNPPLFIHRAAGTNIRDLPAMVHMADQQNPDHPFEFPATITLARGSETPPEAGRAAPKDRPARQGRQTRRR